MKIPTPNLIELLRQPIPRNRWAGVPLYDDLTKIENIMKEAAAQLEWFLNYVEKGKKTNEKKDNAV